MGFEQLGMPAGLMRLRLVPETGIEPVRPLFRKAADFKKNHTNDSVNKYGHFSTKKVIE